MAIGPSDILSALQNGVTATYDLTATISSNSSSGLIVAINSNSSALVTAISCGFAGIFT